MKDTKDTIFKARKDYHNEIVSTALERDAIKNETEKLIKKKEEEEHQFNELSEKYNQLKLLLRKPDFAKTKRQNNETTQKMISSVNTTRYRRRKETKDLLEFVHGGESGAVYGAWDYLSKSCDEDMLEWFLINYKRGKSLEGMTKDGALLV